MASIQAQLTGPSSSTLSLSSKIFEQASVFTSSLDAIKQAFQFPISKHIFYPNQCHFSYSRPLYATLKAQKALVVTNGIISRMGFSIGIPLFIGLLFFPFFYYLKVGLKIEVPTCVPFIGSFFFLILPCWL
ncbi:hypothetical protein P3X46_025987 [Hevea brasiliensis]|uniref:Uncharacterized protein n=1 Tax=Hevea brasiliensis TaxID=3981 RepID=A0ABQ9KWC0_HEVBR|nr:hypothetical protein P3X46_025987 [Hevea brasiliensis]